MKRKLIVLIFFLSASASAYQSPFKFSWDREILKMEQGKELRTDIIIRIPEGHFLYKEKTDLSFTALDGLHVRDVSLPEGVPHKDTLTGRTVRIYPEGELVISVIFSAPKGLKEGKKEPAALLEFQGCEEKLCLRPEVHLIEWEIDVIGQAGRAESDTSGWAFEKGDGSLSSLIDARDFRSVVEKGRLIAIFIAFVAGLLTSLTPCVWPLIPVMLLIIGIHKRGHMLENLLLSLCLVLGMIITYSALGIFASLAGQKVGFLFQQKTFIVIVVLFFVAMSLSMFGLFTIEIPHRLRNVLTRVGGKGYRGAFLSGISMGFLATPCVGPVLGPMLVWVAAEREYVFGMQLLATYALGIGMFYVVIGTFYGTLSNKIHRKLNAGRVTKKVLGVMLLIPAIYYLNSAFPFVSYFKGGVEWRDSEQAALAESLSSGRPVMIVFGARWCPPCLTLERNVLADERVRSAMKKVVPLHIDATNDTDDVNAILDKYGVVGWPTILFVAPDGRVYEDLRIVGKVPTPHELVDLIENAAGR